MGAMAISASFGSLLIDGLGGQLYDSDKRNPFYIVITSEGIAVVLIVALALAKKLHI